MKSLFPRQEERAKIGFATVHSAMRQYLCEVPVGDNPASNRPKGMFFTRDYPQYLQEVIHNGNAVSLLDGFGRLQADNFFEPRLFEKYTRYLFWTFDKWFLKALQQMIIALPEEPCSTAKYLLEANAMPYAPTETRTTMFGKIAFCNRKIKFMRQRPDDYGMLFELDRQNREAVLLFLQTRLDGQAAKTALDETRQTQKTGGANKPPSFPGLLKPIKGSPEQTLVFLQEFFAPLVNERLKGTVRVKDIFTAVPPEANGANPKGLNGTIFAFVDFFEMHGYFVPSLNSKPLGFRAIVQAFLSHTGNTIGNLDTIAGRRQDDTYYQVLMAKMERRAKSRPL